MLGVELITTGKELKPFWNDFSKEISSRLWLPTETDSQGLGQNLLNYYSKVMEGNSWFSLSKRNNQNKNLQSTYLQSSMYSHVKCIEVINTKKIRIKPTKPQAKFLMDWLGSARNSYNYTISKAFDHFQLKQDTLLSIQAAGFTLEEAKESLSGEFFPSWMTLKKKDNTDFWGSREEWLKPIPSKCFTQAIKDACDARTQCFKKGGKFNLKFRSRKDKVQSCFIPKDAVSCNGIFKSSMKRFTGNGVIKFTEVLPDNCLDSELLLDNGQWFICVPYKKVLQTIESQDRVVALDVGVRKFLTFYSEKDCGFIADRAINRVSRLCLKLDKVLSKRDMSSGKLKKSLNCVADKIRIKVKNLMKELHYKTANWLVDNYDIIILPYYEVSDMVLKAGRKLNRKSTRNMLNFSFYKFSQILERKMKEKRSYITIDNVNYSRVVRVNEAFTSKTQTWNGIIKDVGSKETLRINSETTIDRDLNGARNIFIRALVDSPLLVKLTCYS